MARWVPKISAMVNVSDPGAIPAVECAPFGLQVRPSTNQHPDAEMGVFTAKNFWKVELVGNYYGPLYIQIRVARTRR